VLACPGLPGEPIRKPREVVGSGSGAARVQAAVGGRLAATKGFGPAFQAKVLQGLEMSRRPPGRHIHRAALALDHAAAELGRTHPELRKVTPSGDFRRGAELVGRLVLVAIDPRRAARNHEIKAEGLSVHVTSEDRFGITLLLTTGSEKHLGALRAVAEQKGCTLDAEGLRRGRKIIACATEEEIYRGLDLPFIAPELRESGNEVELARRGALVELVTDADIRGVVHVHTERSDGTEPLDVMVQAARDRGYAYLGLTDHSQTASYAGGLKVEEVREQQREVDKLNRRLGASFHVFKGIESDILADGSLDYPNDVLKSFDLVIASIHSRFRMSEREQTERILKAIENPHTSILGHVTGRQLLRRPGYEVDMEAILKACAREGVAIEINANPWRLDMDWRWCGRALELGCLFAIDPDAHATDEIDNLRWGVLMARKGAVPADRVITALGAKDFGRWLAGRKQRSSPLATKRRRAA